MPLDIRTVDGAILSAKAKTDEWMDNFRARWFGPLAQDAAAIMLDRIPADIAARLQAANPEGFAEIVKKAGGLRYANQNQSKKPVIKHG